MQVDERVEWVGLSAADRRGREASRPLQLASVRLREPIVANFRAIVRKLLGIRSPEEILEELRSRDLLVSSAFAATRVFQVEEYEDEGLHYFLELENGSVLYLGGQYLYDFGRFEDDPGLAADQLFPATTFRIVRHRDEGYVVDLEPFGSVLPPEETYPPYRPAEYEAGLVPEDGDVITSRSYDQLKAGKGRLGGS